MKGAVLQPFGLMMRSYLDGPGAIIVNDVEMRMQEMAFFFSRVQALNIEVSIVVNPTGGGTPTSDVFGGTAPRGVSELSGGVFFPINLAEDERDLFRQTLPDKPGEAWNWSATINYSPAVGLIQFDWFKYLRHAGTDFFSGWFTGLTLTAAGTAGFAIGTDASSFTSPQVLPGALAIGGIDLPLGQTYTHFLNMYYEDDPAIQSVSATVTIYPSLFFPWTSENGTPTYNVFTGARLTP